MIPLLKGEVVVYDVTIKYESLDTELQFKDGQQYVVIVRKCPDGVAQLAYGPFAVLRVDNDVMRPTLAEPRPFITELLELGTLTKLRHRLADHASLEGASPARVARSDDGADLAAACLLQALADPHVLQRLPTQASGDSFIAVSREA